MIWSNFARAHSTSDSSNEVQIVELQGTVEVSAAGTTGWKPVQTNQTFHPFDHLRTGANSRMALRWCGQSVIAFDASTELEILPPPTPDALSGLHLIQGIISFFHRDQPGRIQIITRGAVAGVEGTEFVLAVDDSERTTLSVLDGKVKFGNEQASLSLTNGEAATLELGKTPLRTAGFIANNLLQWCFYYPAVLNPDDLQLTAAEKNDLGKSLTDYRAGDLLAALKNYPTNRAAVSDSEKIYLAGLLLSVGQVEACENQLGSIQSPLADALREVITAVKFQTRPAVVNSPLSTVLLANSYYEQSRAVREISLEAAMKFAKQAATISPDFSFAWERVAELEFSFGRTSDALDALNKSLALAPHNAQALALKGFLFAAKNQTREAITWFDQAIVVDSALGNAWLGRGISRIRRGDAAGGREDLLVAAALEPQRAELRSYLGKAYAQTGDGAHATKELTLAKKLDPQDPTPWLYSALLNQQGNEINDAIRDLEKSEELNENRSVYRSQLLLDQDRSVRSANLAGMYRDAGMFDLSVREAGRAVSSDYANYSAHLFLANSYDQLRAPNWSNLRYDTPATAEFYIANLLAPASAGLLSANTSQRPYARLFDDNHFGAVSDTTYLSRGAFSEKADQFYTSDNFSYDVGASYQYDPGQRPNDDFENREVDINLKGQLTAQDSIFGSIQLADTSYGDNNEYYNQKLAPYYEEKQPSPFFRFSETQEPNILIGYHHEWSPGVHTLFLAARHYTEETGFAALNSQYIAFSYHGPFDGIQLVQNTLDANLNIEEYSAELQQIWEQPNHTTIIGARYELGHIRFRNTEFNEDGYGTLWSLDDSAVLIQDFTLPFHHFNLYGYHDWQLFDAFTLDVGLAYDYLVQPGDIATMPFSRLETPFATQVRTQQQISPKAGFIWTPADKTVVRGAYTRSLSGFVTGQSDRLEPTQVAGFNQAFTSLIPESIAGDTSGSRFDTVDLSLEQKFDTGTYLGLSGEILYSKLNELAGEFYYNADFFNPPVPLGLNRSLDYVEHSLTFTIDQLLGKQWSAGGRYRVSKANVDISYVDVNPADLTSLNPNFHPRQNLDSVLHTINLHANWNHPSGLFSSLEGNWYHQSNNGFSPIEPGDDFCQFNAYAGYRFWHRRAEITVGLLNIFDQNYSLEPLNLYNEMARSRTFFARLLISF